MSVILFSKSEVYQDMANAYEGLKQLLYPSSIDDEKFYTSCRRLYFANVATFLCQYHDETPLSKEELGGIDTFAQLQGVNNPLHEETQKATAFLSAWGSLQYNLTTNAGEQYIAKEAYEYIDSLAMQFARIVLERMVGER